MAKLVGLPEETVARVRKQLSAVHREEVLRQKQEQAAQQGSAVVEGKTEGAGEMEVDQDVFIVEDGEGEREGEAAVDMAVDRQDDLEIDSKEISPCCSDGGQMQVPHDEPPFMQIDRSWDDPSSCFESDSIFSPEKLAGADESDKCSVPSSTAAAAGAPAKEGGLEQDSAQTQEQDGSDSAPIDLDTFCCELQFGKEEEAAVAKQSVQPTDRAEQGKSTCSAAAPDAKRSTPNGMLWKAECHGMLRRLTKHAKAWPFLEP
eukprot:1618685-Rhodomonas_salina.1